MSPPAPLSPQQVPDASKLALRGFLDALRRVLATRPQGWPSALGPVMAAQWVLESAWGKRAPHYNYMGLKARPGEPFFESMTWEDVNGPAPGGEVRLPQKFRSFATLTEAIERHGALLVSDGYRRRWAGSEVDPHGFARAIAGRYATDPNYAKKLLRILDAFVLPVWGRA